MNPSKTVLYCHCAYARVLAPEVKNAVLDSLVESGTTFESVPDLCEMAARKDPQLQALAQSPNLHIAACYPRAVKWLFSGAGASLPKDGAVVLNMREDDASDIIAALAGEQEEV